MTNLEFKNDPTSRTISNLALNSIVKVIIIYPRTEGFRPMVSSAVWGKAPAARKTLEKTHDFFLQTEPPEFPEKKTEERSVWRS